MKENEAKVSDLHMGSEGYSKELFIDYLGNYVIPEVKRLDMLGDIFELAGKKWHNILKEEKGTVRALQEASESTDIIYRLGNHDIDLPVKKFRKVFPNITLKVPETRMIILRKRVGSEKAEPKEVHYVLYTGEENGDSLLDHGYIYDHYFFDEPDKWDWLIQLEEAFRGLTGDIFHSLPAWTFKQKLREKIAAGETGSYSMKKIKKRGGNIYWLMLAARDAAMYEVFEEDGVYGVRKRKNPLKRVFFGHTHVQDRRKIYDDVLAEKGPVLYRDEKGQWSGASEYINTGCWKDGNSDFTLVRPDGSLENYQWERFREGYKN